MARMEMQTWMRRLRATALAALAWPVLAAGPQVAQCPDAAGPPCPAGKPAPAGRHPAPRQAHRAHSTALPAAGPEPRQADQSAPRSAAAPGTCRAARQALERVSAMRAALPEEQRLRTNAARTAVNTHCGASLPLRPRPDAQGAPRPRGAVHITHCAPGFCYDSEGGIYHRSGDWLTGPEGQVCHPAGRLWNCQ